MNEILHLFLEWIKDPFRRKEVLSRHSDVIHEMYATQALTRKTTETYEKTVTVQRSTRGANPVERAFLGNRPRKQHARVRAKE